MGRSKARKGLSGGLRPCARAGPTRSRLSICACPRVGTGSRRSGGSGRRTRICIVLCTAYSDHSWTGIVSQLGATDKLIILKKPFDNIEALQLAHALTGKWALNRKLAQRMQDLDALTNRQAAALETAAQRFGAAFFGSPVAFAIVSLPEGELLDANASFQRLVAGDLSPAPPSGSILNFPAWCECDLLRSALATLAAGEAVHEFETRLRQSAGAEVHVHLNATAFQNGSRACALLSVKDISDRRRLENQLRQLQKVESFGALSAAITHDFNNFLTVVKCTLTLGAGPARAAPGFAGRSAHRVRGGRSRQRAHPAAAPLQPAGARRSPDPGSRQERAGHPPHSRPFD